MIDARSNSKGCGHFFTQKKDESTTAFVLRASIQIELESLEQVARKQQAVAHDGGNCAIWTGDERDYTERGDDADHEDDKGRPERKLFRRIESHNQKSSFYHP